MINAHPWKELYGYWLARRVDRRPPRRSALDIPLDLPHLAASLMLIEIVGDRFRYRVAGSALYERYQTGLTGTWVEQRGDAESDWHATLVLVRDDLIPRLLSTPVPGQTNIFHVAVALPLLDDEDKVHQILAGAFFAQEFGEKRHSGRLQMRELLGESI
ncbi:MAG TPA: hypothetical protein VL899_13505 [Alphaproteobacteria bacterium]|jgi:hypothetical protein|nr:hypothetical protein [Alphaproteobacteria bacterium]